MVDVEPGVGVIDGVCVAGAVAVAVPVGVRDGAAVAGSRVFVAVAREIAWVGTAVGRALAHAVRVNTKSRTSRDFLAIGYSNCTRYEPRPITQKLQQFQLWNSSGKNRLNFKLDIQELEQVAPTVKYQTAGQSPYIIEKCVSSAQFFTDEAVDFVGKMGNGVGKKG